MFKKHLLVGVVILAASSVASADGFYLGAGIGASDLHDKNTANVVVAGEDVSTNATYGKFGALGSIFGGYGWSFASQFNLGLEAFANAMSTKLTYSTDDINGSIKDRYSYGVRVLPGYQVTPDADVHAILGYVRGNFKTAGTIIASDYTYNVTHKANGYQLGLGTGMNIAKNMGIRGDVIYSAYQSHTRDFSVTYGGVSAVGSTKNQFDTIDAIISLAYKFG